MTGFSIISAVMILLGLAVLAPALLRRREMAASDRDKQNVIIARERLQEMEVDLKAGVIGQEEFDQAKIELEQALLSDLKEEDGPAEMTAGPGRLTLGVIAVAMPVLAILMYMMLGAPGMLELDGARQASHSAGQQRQVPSVEEMLVAIKQRLQEKPDDAQGWFLLGRTYMALEQYPQAVEAYETLLKLTGDEPTVMLSLAEAITFSQNGDMQGRPAELIQKVLDKEPESQSALWMAGLLKTQQGDYPQAIGYWKRLEPMVQDQPKVLERVRAMIDMVQKKADSPAAEKKAP